MQFFNSHWRSLLLCFAHCITRTVSDCECALHSLTKGSAVVLSCAPVLLFSPVLSYVLHVISPFSPLRYPLLTLLESNIRIFR